jgi:hypothetical protein
MILVRHSSLDQTLSGGIMRYPIGTIVRKPVLTLLILAVVMPWMPRSQ